MLKSTNQLSARDPDVTLLPDLWRRRKQLSKDEMVSMYVLVQRALHAYYPPELRILWDEKDELVAQFFYSKVLRLEADRTDSNERVESAPTNRYALCAYFRRYLIDCLRTAAYRRHVSIDAEGVGQKVECYAYAAEESVETELMQYALDESRVRHLARAFIALLDDDDRILLAGSLGQRPYRKGGLSAVAAAHRVPSYHYRAVKLGVTIKKAATSQEFAQSKIGRWLGEVLGIEISVDNRAVILIVLGLLAEESNAVTKV